MARTFQTIIATFVLATVSSMAQAGELDLAFASGTTLNLAKVVYFPAGSVQEPVVKNQTAGATRGAASETNNCTVILKSSSGDERNLQPRTMQITRIWQPTDLAGNPNATQVNIEVEDTAVKQVHCAFTSKVAAVPDLMANIEPMKLSVRLPKPRDI